MVDFAQKICKRMVDALEFARAWIKFIAWEYAPVYGELLVIVMNYWCWFVLRIQPNYLMSSSRVFELARQLPQDSWECLFLFAALYKTFFVVFGSHPEITIKDRTYLNPFMRTPRAVKVMLSLRIAGLLLGVSINSFVAWILSGQGVSWGTGFFGANVVLCTVAMCHAGGFLVVEMMAPKRRHGLVIRSREVG